MNPIFLDRGWVIRLHRELIEHYGGSHGIRDLGLLDSALAMPRATFGGAFLHVNLIEMATAYLFHLVSNHPFIDGNKRIGSAAAIVFLSINDVEIDNDEDGLVALTLAVAQGQCEKPAIAAFFRERVL